MLFILKIQLNQLIPLKCWTNIATQYIGHNRTTQGLSDITFCSRGNNYRHTLPSVTPTTKSTQNQLANVWRLQELQYCMKYEMTENLTCKVFKLLE